MSMEQPEAGPDLVGRTSARLLAAGIERRDRLEALHLLAILDASIDTSGRVRRPLDDLAAEFELPPMSVMRSLDHLERAGAVQRDGGGVLLLGGSDHGLGGLQLADFLDDVRASFDGDVPRRRRSTFLARSGAALVGAAAMIAVLTLAPSTSVQTPVASRDIAETTIADRLDDAGTASAPGTIDRTIRPSTTIVAPMSSPVLDTEVVAAASPTTTCPVTPTTTAAPSPADLTDAPDGDLAACLEANGLVITGVTLVGPTVEERAAADPAASTPLPPVAVDDAAVAQTVEDVETAPEPQTTEPVARTIRS